MQYIKRKPVLHVIVNHDESELLKKHEPLRMNRIKTSDQKRHRKDE